MVEERITWRQSPRQWREAVGRSELARRMGQREGGLAPRQRWRVDRKWEVALRLLWGEGQRKVWGGCTSGKDYECLASGFFGSYGRFNCCLLTVGGRAGSEFTTIRSALRLRTSFWARTARRCLRFATVGVRSRTL